MNFLWTYELCQELEFYAVISFCIFTDSDSVMTAPFLLVKGGSGVAISGIFS